MDSDPKPTVAIQLDAAVKKMFLWLMFAWIQTVCVLWSHCVYTVDIANKSI